MLDDGETLEDIYNKGKNPLYQWQQVGDIEGMMQEREQRFEAARTDVVEYGKKTGSERLVVLDAKTGKMLEVENGTPDGMILTDAIMALIDDSNNAVRLTHNHPKNLSFSMEDIIVASKPGAESMEVVGHDGSWYRVKLKTADVDLEAKILEMNDEVMNRLGKLVSGKKIKLDSAGQLYHHMVNLALAEIGVIDYEYRLSAPQEKMWMSLEPELNAVVREAATKVESV